MDRNRIISRLLKAERMYKNDPTTLNSKRLGQAKSALQELNDAVGLPPEFRALQGPMPASVERKAGDALPNALDSLIEDIKQAGIKQDTGELAMESALQDAAVYLNRQYDIEDQFVGAGLTPAQARMVEGLEQLGNKGVPRPARVAIPGGELRVHTTYGTNPLTGQQEILPYLDPGTGAVLTTNYGDSRNGGIDLAGYSKASEYVQDRAMRLMGLDPRPNNRGRVTAVDFVVDGKGVDGEVREDFEAQNRNIPVQLYTKTTTPETKGQDKRTVASAVYRALQNEMKQSGGNAISATERLYERGALSDAIEGKLFKDEIDSLLMTTLKSEDAKLNKAAKDKIAIAPTAVHQVDMNAAYDYIKDMSTRETLSGRGPTARLQVRANDGDPNSRNREGRGRIYIRVPENTPGVSTNAAMIDPHVAQLYK